MATANDPRFQDLDPIVNAKFDSLAAQGLIIVEDVDIRIIDSLKNLAPPNAVDALSKLENAVRTSTVRNTSAYLAGVIKRISQLPSDPAEYAAIQLSPAAQDILNGLYAKGLVRQGDLDVKSLKNLSGRSPDLQTLVMETFRDRNLIGIRNMAAYFAAHLTQVERDLKDGRLRLGGPPPPSYSDHHQRGPPRDDRRRPQQQHNGGRYDGRDRDHHRDHHRQYDHRERSPPLDHRRGGDNRFPPPHEQPRHYGPPPPYGAPPPPYAAGAPPPYATAPPHGGYAPPPAQYAPPAPIAVAPAAAYSPVPVAVQPGTPPVLRDYGTEQQQWGVRIEEFHGLSKSAKYVNPAAAFKLQQLWDVDQNKLVSLLTESSWEALAVLDATAAVATIEETVEAMKTAPDDLPTVNAIFMATAGKHTKQPPYQPPYAPPSAVVSIPPTGAPPAAVYAAPPPAGRYPPGPPPPGAARIPPPYAQAPPAVPLIKVPPFKGALAELPPSVQQHIRGQLERSVGQLRVQDFDDNVVAMLERIGERDSLRALDDFARNSPSNMRNITAYLIGCLKKYDPAYKGGDRRGGSGGGGFRGGRGGPDRRGGRGRGGRGDRDRSPRGERYTPY